MRIRLLPRLLLDEHYSAEIAQALRIAGHDVQSVVEDPHLRSQSDTYLFQWAAAQGRRIVTENVKDFRPLLTAAHSDESDTAPLLCVASRRFPRGGDQRSRAIVEALTRWLTAPDAADRPDEDWLT